MILVPGALVDNLCCVCKGTAFTVALTLGCIKELIPCETFQVFDTACYVNVELSLRKDGNGK